MTNADPIIDGGPPLELLDDVYPLERKLYPPYTEAAFLVSPPTYDEGDRYARLTDGHVDIATKAHIARHVAFAHPFCASCAYEDAPYMGRAATRAGAWWLAKARAHWWLENHRGTVPDDPTADEWRDFLAARDVGNGGVAVELLDRDQLDELPEPEPIIDGVLMAHSYIVLAGRHGTKKTFVALDWAACIATGKPWLGRDVEAGRVLYIAGEGAFGLPARLAAWELAWGQRIPAESFTVLPRSVNLLRGGRDLDDLVRIVEEGVYTLVVIDTLRRASSGADENSSKDMGQVVDAIERIKRATDGGSVLVIAHTDKGDNSTRGASAIEDDADIVWRAEADDYRTQLHCSKMKDSAEPGDIHLRARPHGESIVLETLNEPTTAGVGEMTASERRVLSIIVTTFSETGVTAPQLVSVSEEIKGPSRSSVYTSLNALLQRGLIVNRGTERTPRYFPSSNSSNPEATCPDLRLSDCPTTSNVTSSRPVQSNPP